MHRFDNYGNQEAKSVCVISPALLGPEYFREVAAVLKAAGGGPPDRAKMAEDHAPLWPHDGCASVTVINGNTRVYSIPRRAL